MAVESTSFSIALSKVSGMIVISPAWVTHLSLNQSQCLGGESILTDQTCITCSTLDTGWKLYSMDRNWSRASYVH